MTCSMEMFHVGRLSQNWQRTGRWIRMGGGSARMTRRAAFALACCFARILVAHAQGGPPMITDDSGTPGDGQWEINVAYQDDRTALARERSFPHVDLNYGWGDHIQLKY